jgi:hypothetical protein
MVNSVAYINNGNMPKNLDSAEKLFDYIGRRMDSLQTRNIIRRVGPAKGGHWEVVG